MKHGDILQKAILSEKAYRLMEKGIYTFFVSKSASKKDVKNSIEKMFSVSVKKVNVAGISSKQKKIAKTRKTVTVGGGKKAIVYLKAGQTISVLSPKTESKTKKTKKTGEKDIEKVSVEGKEG
ncbi:MAG: 50S ribosomal protein L23 [Candidatus Curtissbacteria bacterium]|nr:50S ribosomal protein L23 [Candidatus Curtissbacteria bacterium]